MKEKSLKKCGGGLKKYFLQTIFPAALLIGVVMLALFPFSCRTSIDGIEFLTGDFSVPQITDVVVCDSNTLSIGFSRNVVVDDVLLTKDGGESIDGVTTFIDEETSRVDFTMENKMDIGEKYLLKATLEDENGNSITVNVDFLGYNDRVPVLALSEARIKNKSKTDKSEFVELYALTSGNLSGLELLSAADGEGKKYCFPPIEVGAGEYIVVHMRKDCPECVDELGDNLNLAKTSDSNPRARDLFAENESEGRFGTSADIIAIRNSAGGKIMDSLVYADSEKPSAWSAALIDFAGKLNESSAWLDDDGNPLCTMESAFLSSTLNRDSHTICRRNVENLSPENLCSTKKQWYEVSTTKAQTPGIKN